MSEDEDLLAGEEFGGQLRDVLDEAKKAHHEWVESGGLRSGHTGPLDNLILALELCQTAAEKAKTNEEEGDD